MNEQYWKTFYDKKEAPQEPSSFARFCLKYIPNNYKIADMGCGNGRDTIFFKEKRFDCIGIDRECPLEDGFIRGDFLDYIGEKKVYYSRFFLHSITDRQIIKFIQGIRGYFMAECRAEGDKPLLYPGHKRNLINGDWLIGSLLGNGFEILYFNKSHGLAKYNGEDPYIIRVIAKKK